MLLGQGSVVEGSGIVRYFSAAQDRLKLGIAVLVFMLVCRCYLRLTIAASIFLSKNLDPNMLPILRNFHNV